MSKKSLVLYRNESTVIKDVKAGDYVITERGYLFNDVHTKRCEIIIEGELSISLTDKYKVITSDEAAALINEYKQPASSLASMKQELEKCKKELEKCKKELEECKNSDTAQLQSKIAELELKTAELEKANEALTKENETLKVKVSELEKANESVKKK